MFEEYWASIAIIIGLGIFLFAVSKIVGRNRKKGTAAAQPAEESHFSIAGENLTAEELGHKLRCIWNDKGVYQRNLDYVRAKTPNGGQLTELEIMKIAYERWIIETRGFAIGLSVREPSPINNPPLRAKAAEMFRHSKK